MFISVSSVSIGSKSSSIQRSEGLPVSEGRVERGLNARDRRLSSNLSINGISNSALQFQYLFYNEWAI